MTIGGNSPALINLTSGSGVATDQFNSSSALTVPTSRSGGSRNLMILNAVPWSSVGVTIDATSGVGGFSFSGGTLFVRNGSDINAGDPLDGATLTLAQSLADLQISVGQSGVWVTDDLFDVDAVTWSAIPEPSTYAIGAGLGALGLVFWRRRR